MPESADLAYLGEDPIWACLSGRNGSIRISSGVFSSNILDCLNTGWGRLVGKCAPVHKQAIPGKYEQFFL